MKRFIDDNATFEITVPITWKYSLVDGHVHTFGGFQFRQYDCFQLSIRQVNNQQEKRELAHLLGFLPPKMINDVDYRCYPDEHHEDDSYVTKAWTTIMGDEIVMFSLTYYNEPGNEANEPLTDEELQMVYDAIGSFRLIEEDVRERTLHSYRFEMFLQGIGATNIILHRAIENKGFIEATCILANQIDSLLRIAIVLQKQIVNQNMRIELEWIYQGLHDKKKSEKDIYKKAKELGVINEEMVDELYKLYDHRNRVVHRFIISEITLAEVETISYRYYEMRERIKVIVDDLESEQLRLGVGMTTMDAGDPGNKSDFLKTTTAKMGKADYFNDYTKP